jgi:pSer/pThr/pTyr-binding forkhead associated (FHA) protein
MINNKEVESPVERSVLDMIPRLVAIAGHLDGWTLYLNEPVVSIGRLWSNDIRLKEPLVSGHHCLIRNEGDEYIIEDLKSTNGTYVDGESVNASSLKEGSLIEIGASRFMFRLPEHLESRHSDLRSISQNLVVAENGRLPRDEIRLG